MSFGLYFFSQRLLAAFVQGILCPDGSLFWQTVALLFWLYLLILDSRRAEKSCKDFCQFTLAGRTVWSALC